MLALAGVAMIVGAAAVGPPLRRVPYRGAWLGAMNPLVILHLVGGIHNESLMLGMMLVGLELGLAAVDSRQTADGPGPAVVAVGHRLAPGRRRRVDPMSSMIKATSIIALGFRHRTGPTMGATLPSLRSIPIRQWWSACKESVSRWPDQRR